MLSVLDEKSVALISIYPSDHLSILTAHQFLPMLITAVIVSHDINIWFQVKERTYHKFLFLRTTAQ